MLVNFQEGQEVPKERPFLDFVKLLSVVLEVVTPCDNQDTAQFNGIFSQ